MLGSALLWDWVCCRPSSVPCQTALCLQTGFDVKYLKKSSDMGLGSGAAGTCWGCGGKQRCCTWASTGLTVCWGSLKSGQHQNEHIWHRDVFCVHEGRCTWWLALLKCLRWRQRQWLGSLALPSTGREPHAFLPATGELWLLGSLFIFSLRWAKHHLRHLGTRRAQGSNFPLQLLSCSS